jgi:YD repeat-containing protein
MQKTDCGVVARARIGWRRYLYLGQGPARQLLLGSLAAFSAACQSSDAPLSASSRETAPDVVLGTARAAVISNTTLTVVGDTFIRQGIANQNEGDEDILSVQIGSVHRSLLFFDTPALQAAVGTGTLVSARIDLFISANNGGWGSGRALGVHSLRQASAENAATWSCAIDTNVSNGSPDCAAGSSWNMNANNATAPFVLTPTSTTQIVNGTNGVVSFDVTQDVLAIVAGTNPGHGWVIKKVDETVSGSVLFASREQGPAPRLTLTVDAPDVCTPVAIDDATCDAIDDDCDGVQDEDVAPVETTCGTGACAATGMLFCAAGQLESTCLPGEPASNDTSCDLVDDDCDGLFDEDYQSVPTSCGQGACVASGDTSCVLGEEVDDCDPAQPAATDSTCDGVDDDCDGTEDEGYESLSVSCGIGACQATGSTSCVAGSVQQLCLPGEPASNDASCDLVDDDCDGLVDEDYANTATSCGIGACAASGDTSCVLGAEVDDCNPAQPAATDSTCDGVDDDCDGSEDEDYASLSVSCGVGACQATGSTSCVAGSVQEICTPGAPAPLDATCDGADDDCNSAVDEDFAPSCSGQVSVSCDAGALQTTDCSDGDACNGQETCSGPGTCNAGTPPELDDGDACTIDTCSPAVGVTHLLEPAGTPCAPYAECNAGGQCVSLLPPDPADVAPALPVGSVSLLDRVRFLFEGEPRIQTGVTPGTIRERTVAVMRGRVLGADGLALPQVTVTVHAHPEYGQTLSRIDGTYDLVVNGGGPLTLRLDRPDHIESQRTVEVPWQDYTTLDDVALVEHDEALTLATLPNESALLHQASVNNDSRGSRSARLYLPAGTSAERIASDGSSTPLAQLSLRASELGVGPDPLSALPAGLPETAAGIYAIELSADEVDPASGAEVEFSQTAALYVDDFVGLPVGTSLPFGGHARDVATWIGAANGRVIRLLGAGAGLADLDIDGSGTPAGSSSLAQLGIDDAERSVLAQTFAPGAAFFRLPVLRLGPYAVSLPFRVDEGSGGVDPKAPGQLAPLDDATLPAPPAETQVLAQSLPLAGTPYTLNYRSSRVLGDRRGQQLAIPATGTSVSSTLVAARVDVQVAGQRHTFSVPPSPSSVVNFEWDGLDAAGRSLHGWQRADIRVGLASPQSYLEPESASRGFAHTAFGADTLLSAPEPHVRWLRYERWLHTFDSRQTDIGAWSINQHHEYDPESRVVYRGDGTSFATRTSSTIIDRFAGIAQPGTIGVHSGDGGLALSARMDNPRDVAVGPDGSIYIATRRGVRRVDADTLVISMVAGDQDLSGCNPSLNDGPANEMCVFARTVDMGRDGALYIGDNPTAAGTFDRIRRLDLATGMISHVAGMAPTSGCANMNDGGLARDAALCNLTAHASAPDGSIYLLDRGSATNPLAVRKISTDGIIDTIANANWPATDDAAALAVGPDGSVYVAQTRSVLRIWPTGEVRLFAGDIKANGDAGDGGPALLARFGSGGPTGVSVGPDGRVVIGDSGNGQLRMVDQQGIIRRIAGNGSGAVNGNGGSPLLALLGPGVLRSSVAPDGTRFLTARSNHTLRVVRPSIGGDFLAEAFVPSPDGTEIYHFSADGRHLDTASASSGAHTSTFGYDATGRLVSVADAAGQVTLIERDASGNPTLIRAPLGEETLLDTDAEGYLSTLVGPDGAETELDYDAGGLLTHMVDASGAEHTYAYDADGRLLSP